MPGVWPCTKKENENHGRLFFKCPRNALSLVDCVHEVSVRVLGDIFLFQYPKLCGYFRFEKQYFMDLKDHGIIIVCPSNRAELEGEEEDAVDSAKVGKPNKELKQKKEKMIRKMNMYIMLAIAVICACVVFFASMK